MSHRKPSGKGKGKKRSRNASAAGGTVTAAAAPPSTTTAFEYDTLGPALATPSTYDATLVLVQAAPATPPPSPPRGPFTPEQLTFDLTATSDESSASDDDDAAMQNPHIQLTLTMARLLTSAQDCLRRFIHTRVEARTRREELREVRADRASCGCGCGCGCAPFRSRHRPSTAHAVPTYHRCLVPSAPPSACCASSAACTRPPTPWRPVSVPRQPPSAIAPCVPAARYVAGRHARGRACHRPR